MELFQANQQWSTRPDDERFLSLDDLHAFTSDQMAHSLAKVVPSTSIQLEPTDNKGLVVRGPTTSFSPTHWAFDQLCARAGAPAGFLRQLPSPMTADNLNFMFQHRCSIDDVGLLLYQNGGAPEMRAATGARYGRIWNAEFTDALLKHVDQNVWHIPGEFNVTKPITKQSTTLYAGDRDMFVFLADGQHDVEIKNRRGGDPGRLQRGFFAWNSEVGSKTFGLGTFLFDYMCCNHIIWGVSGFDEIKIRHTASAPEKWLKEVIPALQSYANGSTKGITEAIDAARAARLDNVDEFLANRFGPRMVSKLKAVHELEEWRPIETRYDAMNAATALAKGIPWIADRVALEREAGKLLVPA